MNIGLGDASEWSLPWSALILARCGQATAAYLHLKIWRDLFVNEGLASVYIPRHWGVTLHVRKKLFSDGLRLTPHSGNMAYNGKKLDDCEIMQLDGTMGVATAIYEMLVHIRGKVVWVFPAVPECWKDVAFSGIQVPGGFLINGKMKNGRIDEVVVHSLRGGVINLAVAGQERMKLRRFDGGAREVVLPGDIEVAEGEKVRLVPG